MGVKKMLNQSAAKENETIKAAGNKANEQFDSVSEQENNISEKTAKSTLPDSQLTEDIATKTKKPAKSKPKAGHKKSGGRPTFASTGEIKRKQYTLTLKESDYLRFKAAGKSENKSFAMFMEQAAIEYIENHFEK